VGALVVLLKVGMVFGLLAVVLFVLKKTDGLGGRARGGLLEVRGSTRLGKGATLTAVRVDGRDLLLGVTDHTVTLLTSEPAREELAQPRTRKPTLPAVLEAFRRPGSTLPPDDVAAALASLRGETSGTPLPVADGSATARSRGAARRRVARTDARPDEEQLWTRACRPTFRAADGDDALA
jgi:flagellar biogenesis protein FliO